MVLEVDVNPESVKKLEKFLGTGKYKDLAVNTQSFSRKLNEERKMRIPYVDGQVILGQTLKPQIAILVDFVLTKGFNPKYRQET